MFGRLLSDPQPLQAQVLKVLSALLGATDLCCQLPSGFGWAGLPGHCPGGSLWVPAGPCGSLWPEAQVLGSAANWEGSEGASHVDIESPLPSCSSVFFTLW